MIKDFYIRYGAKDSKISMLFKYGKLRLTLYVRSINDQTKYLVVKNRDIVFESSFLCEAIKYYRNAVFMEIPEPRDLFNN